MLTFNINTVTNDRVVYLWYTIKANESYFKAVVGDRYMEVMLQVYLHSLRKYDSNYPFEPYMKKLAKTISKFSREIPMDVHTEDGEVSKVYRVLTEELEDSGIDEGALITELSDLYLLDKESFLLLEEVLTNDTKKELKGMRIRNEDFKSMFSKVVKRYGLTNVLKNVDLLLGEVKAKADDNVIVKELKLKESDYNNLSLLDDAETIVSSDGVKWGIDKESLTMIIDPDFIEWDLINGRNTPIYRLDISTYMEYVYTQTHKRGGVNTTLIEWCRDRYKFITPGGTELLNCEFDDYIDLVKKELVLNLLGSNITKIVAIGEDSIYIQPQRAWKFKVLRLMLNKKLDRVVDINIDVYKKNGKK